LTGEEMNGTVIEGEKSALPFSRGILAQSLIVSGLAPREAYEVAREVQSLLEPGKRYRERQLARIVSAHLRRTRGAAVARRYRKSIDRRQVFFVTSGRGSAPFSKMVLVRSLRAAGLDMHTAARVAQEVELRLRASHSRSLSSGRLRSAVSAALREGLGPEYVERYLLWHRVKRSSKPLVVLVGGATGVGKSTLSIELANVLEIPHVASTDIIREMMRTMFSADLLPHIHYASYQADSVRRFTTGADPMLAGFQEQAALVAVGVKAMISRAIKENSSIIVNGVHIVPGIIDAAEFETCITQFLLVLDDASSHRARFGRRQRRAPRRRARDYLRYFPAIRRIQNFLVDRARECGTPTIESHYFEETLDAALNYVTETVAKSPFFGGKR